MTQIQSFISALPGGGARTNRFRVSGEFPSAVANALTSISKGAGALGNAANAVGLTGAGGALNKASIVAGQASAAAATLGFGAGGAGAADKIQFLCRAASIPAIELGEISLPYMGHPFKQAGDPIFPDWEITVLNDTPFDIRAQFEVWVNIARGFSTNQGAVNPLSYMTTWYVNPLDMAGNVLRQYNFIMCYPTRVGEITLNMESGNQIQEFPVTLKYQYWTSPSTS